MRSLSVVWIGLYVFWAQSPSKGRNRIGSEYSIELDMHLDGLVTRCLRTDSIEDTLSGG